MRLSGSTDQTWRETSGSSTSKCIQKEQDIAIVTEQIFFDPLEIFSFHFSFFWCSLCFWWDASCVHPCTTRYGSVMDENPRSQYTQQAF